MEQYTYKFCPDFGLPCKKPIVEIISGTGYEQECEDEGCIEIVLDPDSPDKCVQVLIFCEDCGSCLPIIKDICFCDNGKCGPCQVCGPLGICVDVCKTNEFCEDDKCVECNPNTPCPEGKICVNGKCVCPQGTFFHAPLNKCVECTPGEFIDKCRICDEQGRIVPVPCAGDCDPIEGCVDCLKDSTCAGNTDGRNCCSPEKKCVCCPGYIYDIDLKRCVIKPPCTVDSCGPCETCDPILGCVPVKCPTGFKCDPLKDDCVPDPCPPTPCKDATECGDKCGCNIVCVECSKLSCADCNKALGCFCNPLTGACEKVKDCNNPCTNKYDCAPGCGCDDAACKNCANYSCEECAKINGCACTNGACGDDGTPRGEDGCNDSFKVEKGPVCEDPKLVATLTKDVACSCDPIQFDITPPIGENSAFSILPKKSTGSGLINYSQAGSPLTSDKEYEVQSSLTIQITGTYISVVNGVQTDPSPKFSTKEITIAPKDFRSAFDLIGSFAINLANYTKLETSTVTITHQGTTFTENKCQYNKQVIYSDSNVNNFKYENESISYKNSNKSSNKVTSSSKRDPLFVWYEDLNTIVKREFVSGTGTYISELLPPTKGPYKTKKSYKVTNDCSCEKNALYIWDCGLENYFEKATIDFDIEECGRLFKLKSVTPPCNPLHLKEVYKLYINGAFIADLVNNGVIASPFTRPFNEGVKSVVIKVDTTPCEKDYPVKPTIPPVLDIERICLGESTKVRIPATGIESVKSNGNTHPIISGFFEAVIIDTTTFSIKYTNGCDRTEVVVPKENCCNEVLFTFSDESTEYIVNYVDGTKGLNKTIGIIAPEGFTVSSTSSFITSSLTGESVNIVIPSTTTLTNGSYIVTATKGACTKSITIKLEKSSIKLSINSPKGCSNPILKIERVGASTTPVAFKVENTCGLPIWENTLTTLDTTNLVNQITTTCTYRLTEVGGVEIVPQSVSYEKLLQPVVPSFEVDSVYNICQNNNIKLNLLGSYSFDTYSLFYTITQGVTTSQEQSVIVQGTSAFVSVANCGNFTINLKRLVLDTCQVDLQPLVINYNKPCQLVIDYTKNCTESLQSFIQFTNVPVGVTSLLLTAGLYSATILPESGVFKFGLNPGQTLSNIQDNGFTITAFVNGDPTLYCTRDLLKTGLLTCNRKVINVAGALTACAKPNKDLMFTNSNISFSNFNLGDSLAGLTGLTVKIIRAGGVTTTLSPGDYTISNNNLSINSPYNYADYTLGSSYTVEVSFLGNATYQPFTYQATLSVTSANSISFVYPFRFYLMENIGGIWQIIKDFAYSSNISIPLPSNSSFKIVPYTNFDEPTHQVNINGTLITTIYANTASSNSTGVDISSGLYSIFRVADLCQNVLQITFDEYVIPPQQNTVLVSCLDSNNTLVVAGEFSLYGNPPYYKLGSSCYSASYYTEAGVTGDVTGAPTFPNCESCNPCNCGVFENGVCNCTAGTCGGFGSGCVTSGLSCNCL